MVVAADTARHDDAVDVDDAGTAVDASDARSDSDDGRAGAVHCRAGPAANRDDDDDAHAPPPPPPPPGHSGRPDCGAGCAATRSGG
mmetsp:Transcript_20790/g.59589  ORF Transcript_20790/g.59589 Transcript_20790/m.59589 type:complete len:86 (-) Transcript_20790:1395-1652(-)